MARQKLVGNLNTPIPHHDKIKKFFGGEIISVSVLSAMGLVGFPRFMAVHLFFSPREWGSVLKQDVFWIKAKTKVCPANLGMFVESHIFSQSLPP